MTTTTLLRRTGVLLVSTGTAAALALLPSAAHASVHSVYGAQGNADATYVGPTSGGTCTLTSGLDSVTTTPTTFSHGTRNKSVSINATFTSSDSASDQVQVKGHLNSTLTIKRSHRDLKSFHLQTGGKLTTAHTVSGSACQGSGSLLAGSSTGTTFTEHKKGKITLTRTTKKANTVAEFVLINMKSNKLIHLEVVEGSAPGTSTATAKIKPGTYEMAGVGGIFTGAQSILKSPQRVSKVNVSTDLLLTFKPHKKHHH
jgi:hypothetical protein